MLAEIVERKLLANSLTRRTSSSGSARLCCSPKSVSITSIVLRPLIGMISWLRRTNKFLFLSPSLSLSFCFHREIYIDKLGEAIKVFPLLGCSICEDRVNHYTSDTKSKHSSPADVPTPHYYLISERYVGMFSILHQEAGNYLFSH